jgi:hypothetical protein
MTNEDLDGIVSREQRATLGPWTVKRVQNLYPSEAGDGRTYPAVRGFRCPKAIYERAWEQVEQDATFIAAARNDVPTLANEVRRLRRRLQECRLIVAEAATFQPRVTPAGLVELVERLVREEEAHWRGGPVPPPREPEHIR